jgi:hypothetical protein
MNGYMGDNNMVSRYISISILSILLAIVLAIPGFAALSWDGQSGIFLNSLAYTLKESAVEISAHSADLDSLGSVETYNLAVGLKGNVELGYTRYSSRVTGVKDQNLLLAKWQFHSETSNEPAIAIWAINRDLAGGPNDFEWGLSATKIVTVAKHPLVLDLGGRSTKSLGLGLFGVGNKREIRFEGSAALFVTPKFAVGTEFKQQIDSRQWSDIAFRYVPTPNLNIDLGIANFNNALSNQLALAFTYSR